MRLTACIAIVLLICDVRLSAAPDATVGETMRVEIPATSSPHHPIKITTVMSGQKVTVSIGRVLWKGGGSKTGDSTDWRGYRNRTERNSLPWMALVLGIGKHHILPDKRTFTFTAPASGELVAFANDSNPDGNSGKGEITVVVAPPD
jgi:hypothetical protein